MTIEDKRAKLEAAGFTVGARDARINTDFPGRFMVAGAYDESELPTRNGASGPWAIVGNDLSALINEAFGTWEAGL